MKKGQVGIAVAAVAVFLLAQAQAETIWEGQGGTDNWSDPSNWVTGGVGGVVETDVRFAPADTEGVVVVDTTPTLKIMIFQNGATNFVFSGNTITLNNETPTVSSKLFQNNSTNSVQTFNNDIRVVSDGKFDYVSGGVGSLVFNGAFTVEGTDEVQLTGGRLVFNNALTASGGLRIAANTHVVFSNSVPNGIGALTFIGDGDVAVDTVAGVSFYDGAKIQHNSNGTFTFNNANVLGDATYINVNGKTVEYNFNADEELGSIILLAGTMNLTLGNSVSQLSFLNSSTKNWTGGSLVISNFVSGVVRFGTNTDGLTLAQLEAISAYDYAGAPVADLSYDSSGFLVGTVSPPPPIAIGDVAIEILPGGTQLSLTWGSTNEALYAVESTTDLAVGGWQDAITNIVGNGGDITVTDAVAEVQSFYRVYLEE